MEGLSDYMKKYNQDSPGNLKISLSEKELIDNGEFYAVTGIPQSEDETMSIRIGGFGSYHYKAVKTN